MKIQGTIELWINGHRVRKAKYADKYIRKNLIKNYYHIRESYEEIKESFILIKPNYGYKNINQKRITNK